MPKFRSLTDLVQRYQALFLPHQPTSFAVMQPAGSSAKYRKQLDPETRQPLAPTWEDVEAHLLGSLTLAIPLIGAGALASLAAADIDVGGDTRLWAMLEAARRRGLHAFAIACPGANDHDGGHVWLRFGDLTNPERLAMLMQSLAAEASLLLGLDTPFEVEAYPTRKVLRAPLGRHTWTERRGRLLLQAGRVIDLDAGAAALETALEALEALPLNDVALLPPPPPEKPVGSTTTALGALRGDGELVAEFNRTADLIALLESAGGEIAEALPHGGYLFHCPCGRHPHGDRRPSLELAPARRTERYGRFVLYGYAPACVFKTERGQVVDAFHVYCHVRQQPPRSVIAELRRELQGQPASAPPYTDAGLQPAADPNQPLVSRAEQDEMLQSCARQVLRALVAFARGRSSCRPSVQRLATMTGMVDRTIYRGLQQLEGRYITSEPVHSQTTIRHFIIESKQGEHARSDDGQEQTGDAEHDNHPFQHRPQPQRGGSGHLDGLPAAVSGSPQLPSRSPQLDGAPTGRSPIHGCEIHESSCEIPTCQTDPCKRPPDQPCAAPRGLSPSFVPPGATGLRAGKEAPGTAARVSVHQVQGHLYHAGGLGNRAQEQPGFDLAAGLRKTPQELVQLWQTVLAELRAQVVRTDYDLWLKPTMLLSLNEQLVIVGAANRQVKEALENRFIGPIRRALASLLGVPVQVRIVLSSGAGGREGGERSPAARSGSWGPTSLDTAASHPAWIPAELWALLPALLRSGLQGSRLVNGEIRTRTEPLTRFLLAQYPRELASLVAAGTPGERGTTGIAQEAHEAAAPQDLAEATTPQVLAVDEPQQDRPTSEEHRVSPASSPGVAAAQEGSRKVGQDMRKNRTRVKTRFRSSARRCPRSRALLKATTQLAIQVVASPMDRTSDEDELSSPASPGAAPAQLLSAAGASPQDRADRTAEEMAQASSGSRARARGPRARATANPQKRSLPALQFSYQPHSEGASGGGVEGGGGFGAPGAASSAA